MRSSFRLTTAVLALALAAASTPALADDTQYWQTLQVKVKLDGNTELSNETVFRSSDAKGFYEMENSLLLGYKFDKKLSVQAGWVANPLYNHGTYKTMENRFRGQVTYDGLLMIGKAKVSGRLRLEARWRDGFTGTGWRLRPYVKVAVPLAKKLSLNLTNEAFIDLNTNAFQKVKRSERWRSAVLLSAPLSKSFSLDLGFLNQHNFVPAAADTDDRVAVIQLNASF